MVLNKYNFLKYKDLREVRLLILSGRPVREEWLRSRTSRLVRSPIPIPMVVKWLYERSRCLRFFMPLSDGAFFSEHEKIERCVRFLRFSRLAFTSERP